MGFEVGVFEDVDNYYSSVFHELIFGQLDDLTSFATRLNQNLLFAGVADAIEFSRRCAALAASGADLECPDSERALILVAAAVVEAA